MELEDIRTALKNGDTILVRGVEERYINNYSFDKIINLLNLNMICIKPKAQYRPFCEDDWKVFMNAVFKHRNPHNYMYMQVTQFDGDCIYFDNLCRSYQELFDNYDMFIDSLDEPMVCGVKYE